jgi:hypothetical protein
MIDGSRIVLARTLGCVLACALSLSASAVRAGDKKTYPGSFCHTNVVDDFGQNYYQNLLGRYFHLSDSPAVLCPVLRDVGSNTDGLANVVIWISAPGAGSVGCGIYMMDSATGMISGQASQGIEFGPEGGVKKVDFNMPRTTLNGPAVSARGPIGLACGVPPGFAIIGYMVEEYSAGDSD